MIPVFRRLVLAGCLATLVLCTDYASAQKPLPLAGRSFTFGIIEGAENLPGVDTASHIALTVLGPYDGKGTITSPSGYTQDFVFSAMKATIISLPRNLIHSKDLGKTDKGLIVRTTEPVGLTLHDFILEAGDATQLYPDDALDSDYVVAEWGVWDDAVGPQPSTFEDNHSEILVTAPHDSTEVTITPTVLTMLGHPANVPFTITLNAGECYIVKADSTGIPVQSSLANSTVVSSKPVSVIVGSTCAYVPLTVESCNELMDEIVGKSRWSTQFFIAPLGNGNGSDTGNVRAMLTSDRDFFYTINGAPAFASHRVELSFSGPTKITTSVPAELHELAVGSALDYYGLSDPTLVTVLDSSLWSDTLLWNAPAFNGAFVHYASIIYPTAAESMIRLDSQPIASLTSSKTPIAGSGMSAMLTSVKDGVHLLTSPVPIFAIAAGWQSADGYSFLPGTIGAYEKPQASVSVGHPLHSLLTVSPNPTSGPVAIKLWTDEYSSAEISIVNVLGIEVAHLFSGELEAGEHTFMWGATSVPAGVYAVRLVTPQGSVLRRVVRE